MCEGILISGGSVTAKGGKKSAGIGCGYVKGYTLTKNKCHAIIITPGVTIVTARKGSDAPYSIGQGDAYGDSVQSVGSIVIGGTLDDEGDPVGGESYDMGIPTSPFTYQPSNQ